MEKIAKGAQKLRDFYNMVPDAPIYQCEFGYYSLDRWKREGHITDKTDLNQLFGFDVGGSHSLEELGWCEAAFLPEFDVEILEDRGEYELERDHAGRHVLYFKGRRDGFMPEYVDHPVKDQRTFEEDVKWRMDPHNEKRFETLEKRMKKAQEAVLEGQMIVQRLIGGYMYLRSLVGPLDLLYKFHDEPELIHSLMEAWFDLADRVIEEHQKHVTLDELFLAEDICYNHGSLISPQMMKEFLLPYYEQLIENIRKRQLDRERHLHIQIDTDGFADPVIPLYRSIGMDYMSPFEVAAGCDVIRAADEYPDLRIKGGMDKRILARGKDAIDRMVYSIVPQMKKRGGYIPVCDHGVPEEVSFENYMHFRKRLLEFA